MNDLGSHDDDLLRRAIACAAKARNNGNQPFGAIIVAHTGQVLAISENTIVTDRDATMHAETNAIRTASREFDSELLKHSTLYASTEPCAMCCGAIHWAGIPRIVFGCSARKLADIIGSDDFLLPSREIFRTSDQPRVQVVGPLLEAEAIEVHHGFWRRDNAG